MTPELQVKSKERVKDHGEVFTNKREVNAMLDLVADEANRVDSRFLEPACGNGNFLVAILERKLQTVIEEHNANQADFEKYIFMAVASIYAIDIQEDNCQESRERMLSIVEDVYKESSSQTAENQFFDVIEYILNTNIVLGDGLTGLRVDGSGLEIIFSEYEFKGEVLVRKDFAMNDMIAHNQKIERDKKLTEENSKQGGFLAILSPQKETEELKPRLVKEYENFKKII